MNMQPTTPTSPDVVRELRAVKRAVHYLTLMLVLCTVILLAAMLQPGYVPAIMALVGILLLVIIVAGLLGASAAKSRQKSS